jgi:DNA-binding transcriptional MerR regulator
MSDRENHSNHPEREVVWLDDTESGRGVPVQARDQVLSIDAVAMMFSVPIWTLSYYEWRGLIRRRHRHGQVRVYGWADCERLSLVIKCRKAGLPLRGIVAIIEATEDDAPVSVSRTGQEQCMVQVDRLEQRRKVIEEALAELSHVYALLTSKIVGPGARREQD